VSNVTAPKSPKTESIHSTSSIDSCKSGMNAYSINTAAAGGGGGT
jgi:hypothetical protein